MKKSLLITIVAIIVLSSCSTRNSRERVVKELPNESTDRKLSIQKIDGHEYVIYNNGQFGNSMVHHAGCKSTCKL